MATVYPLTVYPSLMIYRPKGLKGLLVPIQPPIIAPKKERRITRPAQIILGTSLYPISICGRIILISLVLTVHSSVWIFKSPKVSVASF